jgi:hypothetical protein
LQIGNTGTIVVDEERQRDRLVYLLFSPPLEIKDYKQSDFSDEELFGPGIMRKTLANWKYREYWFLKSDCL